MHSVCGAQVESRRARELEAQLQHQRSRSRELEQRQLSELDNLGGSPQLHGSAPGTRLVATACSACTSDRLTFLRSFPPKVYVHADDCRLGSGKRKGGRAWHFSVLLAIPRDGEAAGWLEVGESSVRFVAGPEYACHAHFC